MSLSLDVGRQISPASFDLSSSKKSMAMVTASQQADVLRRRRTKNKVDTSEENGFARPSGTLDDPTQHPTGESSRFSNFGSREGDGYICKEVLDNISRDLLTNVQNIDIKLDSVISHLTCLDTCFDKYADAIHEKMLDAWQIMYDTNGTDKSDNTNSPPQSGRPTTIGNALSSKRPPEKPFHVSPPSSPPGTPRFPSLTIDTGQRRPHSPSPRLNRLPTIESINRRLNALDTKQTHTGSTESSERAANLENIAGLREEALRPRERGQIAKILWLYLEDPRLLPGGLSYVRILILIILASCCVNIVQTSDSPPLSRFTQKALSYTVDSILTMEIIVRFLVCPNRLSFWTYPHNVLDIVTGPLILINRIIVFVLFPHDADGAATDQANSIDDWMQAWMPLVQLLRLMRRFEASHLIWTAAKMSSEALPVLLYVLLLILTFFSSLLYLIEPRDSIGSLPESWWFTIVTLGTVGYGDITPATPAGRVCTCGLVIVSALYMAMPIGIVGHAFSCVWEDRKRLLLTKLARQRLKSLGFTAEDIPALFLSADTNMDGNLDVIEFTEMMKKMQFDTSGQRAMELFKVFDVDGGGCIDDREFLSVLYPEVLSHIYGAEDDAGNAED